MSSAGVQDSKASGLPPEEHRHAYARLTRMRRRSGAPDSWTRAGRDRPFSAILRPLVA